MTSYNPTPQEQYLIKLSEELDKAYAELDKAKAHKAKMIGRGFTAVQLWPAVDLWAERVAILSDIINRLTGTITPEAADYHATGGDFETWRELRQVNPEAF